MVVIQRPKAGAAKNKPGILIYAREYGDEIDGSWPAQGAIQFLASDSPEARRLRAHYEFLVIPILDPDGAAIPDHGCEAESFVSIAAVARQESSVFADFLQKWINTGHRIDIALNEHCLEAGYGRDVSCAAVTGGKPYEPTGTPESTA